MTESPTGALTEALRRLIGETALEDIDAAESEMHALVRHYGSNTVGAALLAMWDEQHDQTSPHRPTLPP